MPALARLAQLDDPPPEIMAVMEALRRPSRDLAREFERALAEQLPLIKRDGGFVREGYEAALDEAAICATLRASSSPRCRRAMPTTPASRA